LYNTFTKSNLDDYFKELAKEYKKLKGRFLPAEIVLVGGAAILTQYGFRDMTVDIDAVIYSSSSMQEAINVIGDRFNLPNRWLNPDFVKTASYSDALTEISRYYKSYYNVLTVRVVPAEYLIAMKLRSERKYKHDLSDVVGIMAEHQKKQKNITYDDVYNAVVKLYGSWNVLSKEAKRFFDKVLKTNDLEGLYKKIKKQELEAEKILVDFGDRYPNVANGSNVDDILRTLRTKDKKNKRSI